MWRYALDEVITGKIGKPVASRVITPAHEGVVSSVWQSSHNSGFIHHMGIILLTGTTPKKSYTRSSPASESLNNPIPLLSTHCVWLERERANEQELLTERKNTFILGRVPLQRRPIYVQRKMVVFLFFMLSLFLSKYLWHPLLMALITDISQDPYQLGFSCLYF